MCLRSPRGFLQPTTCHAVSDHNFTTDHGTHLWCPLATRHQRPVYQLKTGRWTGSTGTKRQSAAVTKHSQARANLILTHNAVSACFHCVNLSLQMWLRLHKTQVDHWGRKGPTQHSSGAMFSRKHGLAPVIKRLGWKKKKARAMCSVCRRRQVTGCVCTSLTPCDIRDKKQKHNLTWHLEIFLPNRNWKAIHFYFLAVLSFFKFFNSLKFTQNWFGYTKCCLTEVRFYHVYTHGCDPNINPTLATPSSSYFFPPS